jgi:hypothetical protein
MGADQPLRAFQASEARMNDGSIFISPARVLSNDGAGLAD